MTESQQVLECIQAALYNPDCRIRIHLYNDVAGISSDSWNGIALGLSGYGYTVCGLITALADAVVDMVRRHAGIQMGQQEASRYHTQIMVAIAAKVTIDDRRTA